MIFFSVGLPGCFTEWCDAVIPRLAQCALGSIEVLGINTLEELALAIRTDASQFCRLLPPASRRIANRADASG
jgi:hypothetical protein